MSRSKDPGASDRLVNVRWKFLKRDDPLDLDYALGGGARRQGRGHDPDAEAAAALEAGAGSHAEEDDYFGGGLAGHGFGHSPAAPPPQPYPWERPPPLDVGPPPHSQGRLGTAPTGGMPRSRAAGATWGAAAYYGSPQSPRARRIVSVAYGHGTRDQGVIGPHRKEPEEVFPEPTTRVTSFGTMATVASATIALKKARKRRQQSLAILAQLPKSKMELELQKANADAELAERTAAEREPKPVEPVRWDGSTDILEPALEEGDDGKDNGLTSPRRRSSSPVIIWRPSARVKLATDIPLELLTGLADSLPHGGTPYVSTEPTFYGVPPTARLSAGTQGMAAPDAMDEGAHTDRGPRRVNKYGAWYLPPKQWNRAAKLDGADPQESEESAKDAKLQDKTALLSTLYSSRIYKEYIKQSGARVPHYLANVDTSPVHLKHGRHRRGIYM